MTVVYHCKSKKYMIIMQMEKGIPRQMCLRFYLLFVILFCNNNNTVQLSGNTIKKPWKEL